MKQTSQFLRREIHHYLLRAATILCAGRSFVSTPEILFTERIIIHTSNWYNTITRGTKYQLDWDCRTNPKYKTWIEDFYTPLFIQSCRCTFIIFIFFIYSCILGGILGHHKNWPDVEVGILHYLVYRCMCHRILKKLT